MLREDPMFYPTADILHQADDLKLMESGWVSGDVWFSFIEMIIYQSNLQETLGSKK